MNRILIGDCRVSMRELIAQGVKVQTVVTSPPYYALRDYGIPPTVWGGDANCMHEWVEHGRWKRYGGTANSTLADYGNGLNAETLEEKNAGQRLNCSSGDFCSKCEAWRGNLGLEPTPWMWVAHIVEVFDLVYELLADDGTVWLNLGDSYASDGGVLTPHNGLPKNRRVTQDTVSGAVRWRTGASGNKGNGAAAWDSEQGSEYRYLFDGIKQKDMMGMPWAAAMALRQPRYTGRIRNEIDRVWLAAMLDAEGCIFIHKRKAGQSNGQGYARQSDTYSPGIEITNTSAAIVERIARIAGKGSVCEQGPDNNGRRKQTLYRWNLRANESRELVRELYPHLVAKQHQARLLYGCPSSGELAEAAHAGLMALHRGSGTDVDLPAPPSCHRPGWYLRQDIIWQKRNPMPESVKDRCTKAHEYLFLLSKKDRYLWDWEAISEPCSANTHARLAHDIINQKGSDRAHQGARRNGKPMKAVPPAAPKDAGRDEQGLRTSEAFGRGAGWRDRAPGVTPKSAGLTRDSGIRSNESFHTNHSGVVDRRNKRTVWLIGSEPFKEAHFATFPRALVEPCILAGSRPGDIVFDPFGGSGTTAEVATRLGRQFLICEIKAEYEPMQRRRIAQPGLVLA